MAKVAVIVVTLFAALAARSMAIEGPHGKKRGAGAMLLEKMNNFVQNKGQIGLSPAEISEVTEIRQILQMDIMPSLLENAADAQAHIDALYQDVLDCQVQVTTGLQINREMWTDTVTKQKIVTECFYKDKLIIDAEKEVCTKYEQIKTVLKPPAIPPPDETDNAEAYQYLKELSEYFCSIPVEFKHTWEECKMIKQNHTERFHWCEDNAIDYEEAICGWDAELNETCTEYMGCWNESLAKYHDAIAALTNLQEDWEAEMDAVEKLDCLWEAWNLSSDPCVVNMTMVYKCEEIPINYTNVTLIVPEPPEPKSCPPPPEPEQDDPALPCSSEFMSASFGYLGLPKTEMDTIKADCHECPHTRPTIA
mmetsp:Transcript_39854/g.93872  ORF Transcript_39854/g.93872 Transcript_39854/m.93872 type:complete len:364 (-) Transcript_39854:152-1243(-)